MNEKISPKFNMIKVNAAEALNTAIREKKIDPLMIGICTWISQTPEFFTTSTCSGRTTLMDLNSTETKKENVFYRKWHSTVKFSEVWEAIEKYEKKGNLWLRQDPFVYVVGTNSWENAQRIIRACQEAGVKRYGIHHAEKDKMVMEIFGTQNMSVPVKIKGKMILERKSVQECARIANEKWKRNEKKRKQLEKALKKWLK